MIRDLAMFDFDGTITRNDSLSAFIIYTKGPVRFLFGIMLLSPCLLLFGLRILSRKNSKEQILSYFFKGMKESEFQALCSKFSTCHIPKMLRQKAMDSIQEHFLRGDRIVVVSASPENWVREWASLYGLECVATRLEVKNKRLTGKIHGENCQGIEKVRRVKAYLELEEFSKIYTYADSKSDWPFLHLGTDKHFKPFGEHTN